MRCENVVLGLIRLIPIEPIYKSYMFHCPACDKVVRIGYEDRKPDRCKCGQKLDWKVWE